MAPMAKRGRIDQTTGPVIDLTPEDRAEFRRLRKSKKLTQEQLADKIHVSTATISNIETGRSDQPRRAVYLEALRFLKDAKAEPVNENRSARFKRVMDKYMQLDEGSEKVVEATIDAMLATVKKPN